MTGLLVLVVSFVSFIVLGIPDGMMGVAWPSISRTFAVPLGSLGLLMAGFTIGYVTTTALLGWIVARLGYGRVMVAAAASMTLGAAAMVFNPWWVGVLVAMTLIGTGSGLLDGGLNAYGAAYFRPRDLNWLHAFYGIGATLGPAIMTPFTFTTVGWRGGYAVLALFAAIVLIAFLVTRRRWHAPTGASFRRSARPHDGSRGTARGVDRVAFGSILIFFLYTGIEVIAGQWAFSLLTIERSVNPATAGTWVGIYWAALTVGRIVFGWISERFPATAILRTTLFGAAVGIGLLFIRVGTVAAPLGLAILGFSLAPMFPLLIGETPRRVGRERADHLIGFQIAAANIGAVTLVGIVGLGVELIDLEVVPWALLISFLVFTTIHEGLVFLTPEITPEQDDGETRERR